MPPAGRCTGRAAGGRATARTTGSSPLPRCRGAARRRPRGPSRGSSCLFAERGTPLRRNHGETGRTHAGAMTHTNAPLAVHASGLVKDFGDNRAVDGIDLEVRRGEVFGVLGPNGAGKTTMLSMLATLLSIDEGQAAIFGVDVRREPHRIRQLLGVTGQYASVDENLTARENLWLFGRLLGMSGKGARATGDRLLGQFALEEAADKPISQFSGGMRRRLDLAASLINRPPLIFLDEPTTGLDPRTRGQMWDTIRGLVADGCTVLLTTQYLDEADQL